jgi:hypothetical protein
MPASTARLVLENGTLRWSSPSLFNDPFDVPRELLFGITPAEIAEALARRFVSLIDNPPTDTTDLQPDLKRIVDAAAKHGISQELRSELIAAFKGTPETNPSISPSLEELRGLWRGWIPEFRILCLTESPAHSAMWFHYADKYSGVVLEFNCNDELDSTWFLAEPVTYGAASADILGADGWAKIIMMPNELAKRALFHVSTYTKSSDWSYENEWRVVDFKRPSDAGLFTDRNFDPRELSSIYLGPLTSPADQNSLVTVAAKYPHIRIFKGAIGMSGKFLFDEIGR